MAGERAVREARAGAAAAAWASSASRGRRDGACERRQSGRAQPSGRASTLPWRPHTQLLVRRRASSIDGSDPDTSKLPPSKQGRPRYPDTSKLLPICLHGQWSRGTRSRSGRRPRGQGSRGKRACCGGTSERTQLPASARLVEQRTRASGRDGPWQTAGAMSVAAGARAVSMSVAAGADLRGQARPVTSARASRAGASGSDSAAAARTRLCRAGPARADAAGAARSTRVCAAGKPAQRSGQETGGFFPTVISPFLAASVQE